MQREHIGLQRVVVGPCRQHGLDVAVQLRRVAAVEVEQVQPLQGERVARVTVQEAFPALARADRVAGGEASQGGVVVALAFVAVDRRAAAASSSSASAAPASEGSVRLSRKPAFIRRGSGHAGSAAIAASRSASGVP